MSSSTPAMRPRSKSGSAINAAKAVATQTFHPTTKLKRVGSPRLGRRGGMSEYLVFSYKYHLLIVHSTRQQERKPLASAKGATIDVDAIWAQLSSQPVGRPADPLKQTEPIRVSEEDYITIKRTTKFAGQITTEERRVLKTSAEARLYLEEQEREKAANAKKQQQQQQQQQQQRQQQQEEEQLEEEQ